MKPRMLVLGSAYTDFFIKTDRIPIAGQSFTGSRYEYLPGGKGVYSAITLINLGAECILCARLGADSHGSRLKAFLESRGIDSRFVKLERQSQTGLNAVIQEDRLPGRSILYPGANLRLNAEDAEEAFTAYPDALLTQFDLPAAAVAAAVSFARNQGTPCFLDATFTGTADRDFPLERLEPVEALVTDESTILALTGVNPSDSEKCMRACLALAQRVTAKFIVIRLGARGIFFYDGTYFKIIAPYDVPATDPSACGSAFCAALAFEYIRSREIARACEYANIIGALVISRPGASASIPTSDEVAAFVAENELEFKL